MHEEQMRRVAISDMFGSGSAMVNNGADGGESQNSSEETVPAAVSMGLEFGR